MFDSAGLGDIAVPGLLACLALRFDLSKLLLLGSGQGKDAQKTAAAPEVSLCCARNAFAVTHVRSPQEILPVANACADAPCLQNF